MSIGNDITRLKNAKASMKTSLTNKGVSVAATTKLDGYASLISQISSGVNTSDATAAAVDILAGKTAYALGSKLTGTMPKYIGTTTVSPTGSTQTLQTAGQYVGSNITVYGVSRFSYISGSASQSANQSISVNCGFYPGVAVLLQRRNSDGNARPGIIDFYNYTSSNLVWGTGSSPSYTSSVSRSSNGYTLTFTAPDSVGTVYYTVAGYY